MYEVLIILTLFAPGAQPMQQEVIVFGCQEAKARIEETWSEAPTEFYGSLRCEKRKREKEKKNEPSPSIPGSPHGHATGTGAGRF